MADWRKDKRQPHNHTLTSAEYWFVSREKKEKGRLKDMSEMELKKV